MAGDRLVPRHGHGLGTRQRQLQLQLQLQLQDAMRLRDAGGRARWRWRAACAERPRTAASSRRDVVSVCAWAERFNQSKQSNACGRADGQAVRNHCSRCARSVGCNVVVETQRVQMSMECTALYWTILYCTTLHFTWTWGSTPDGERMLTCLGPKSATGIRASTVYQHPPQLRSLEPHNKRSRVACLAHSNCPEAAAHRTDSCNEHEPTLLFILQYRALVPQSPRRLAARAVAVIQVAAVPPLHATLLPPDPHHFR